MNRATVNLKHVALGDFRKSEPTLYNSLPKWQRDTLKGQDCVCFVSKSGNQILFVYKVEKVTRRHHNRILSGDLVVSVRMRITRGKFSLSTLGSVAKKCGIRIRNFDAIEEFYEESVEVFAA